MKRFENLQLPSLSGGPGPRFHVCYYSLTSGCWCWDRTFVTREAADSYLESVSDAITIKNFITVVTNGES